MKPFKSAADMIAIHEGMFGDAGRVAAESVLYWAPKLFAAPLDPLMTRMAFEIGP